MYSKYHGAEKHETIQKVATPLKLENKKLHVVSSKNVQFNNKKKRKKLCLHEKTFSDSLMSKKNMRI